MPTRTPCPTLTPPRPPAPRHEMVTNQPAIKSLLISALATYLAPSPSPGTALGRAEKSWEPEASLQRPGGRTHVGRLPCRTFRLSGLGLRV